MQRKIIQTFLSAALRPGLNVYTTPRLHFHLMKHVLFSKSSSITAATEERTDFSDLSSEEFGTLRPHKRSIREKIEELPEEEEERIEYDVTNEEGRKNRRPKEYYEKLIEDFLAEKKMVEALDVLETRIMKKDKLRPWYRVYNLLINGCAKVGYCDKAFALFREMKVRHVKPTPSTYTGLLNAIANSPFPANAGKKLSHLRKTLAENGHELTTINYHAMIKAYARLKDPYSAFLVADEMVSKGHAFTTDTCCFLMQACISDTEAGLRHALLLWHKMRSRKLEPNAYTYNLLFRCIRDCGFGTEADLKNVLRQITSGKREEYRVGPGGQSSWSKRISWKRKSKKPLELAEGTPEVLEIECESIDEEIDDDVGETKSAVEEINSAESELRTVHPSDTECELTEPELRENKPNLLCDNPHLGNIVAVRDVKTASDRLLLLGGLSTILEQMESDEVKPDIKTYTLMLDVVPATDAAEELVLKEMKKNNVPTDIDFYNMLIKKRATRHDYEKAQEVLNLIQADYLQPDIVTFGVLAISCNKVHEAVELVHQLMDFGYRLNMPILGAMLSKACNRCEFDYILYVMKKTRRIGIRVSEEYLRILDDFDDKVKDILRRKKQGDPTVSSFFHHPAFIENYRMWKKYYADFKKEIEVYVPPHPYQQFQKIRDDPEVMNKAGSESEMVANESETDANEYEKPRKRFENTSFRRERRNSYQSNPPQPYQQFQKFRHDPEVMNKAGSESEMVANESETDANESEKLRKRFQNTSFRRERNNSYQSNPRHPYQQFQKIRDDPKVMEKVANKSETDANESEKLRKRFENSSFRRKRKDSHQSNRTEQTNSES